jgi:hypothetical protein
MSLDLQESSHFLNSTIPELTNQFVEVVHRARRNAINAQIRFNIAQLVLTAAIQQGYQPESGQFAGNDFRNEYAATAISPDGNTIRVCVRADGDYDQQIFLDNSGQKINSESEMRRRMLEILQSLQSFGVNVGSIESSTAPRTTNPRKSLQYIAERKSSYAVQRP